MHPPKDLFKFVENNQAEIHTLTEAFAKFLRERKPNPYVVLASLTNIIGFIVEHNFIDAEDADHLQMITEQTLEAYRNTIMSKSEEIMRGRFNETFFEEGSDYDYPKQC